MKMNINDPFGRMQVRRERNYNSLCESLKKAGLTKRDDARDLQQNMEKRCNLGLMIIVPVSLLLALIFPEAWMFSVLFGAMICVWLVNTTSRGKEFVERYIQEELSGQENDSA